MPRPSVIDVSRRAGFRRPLALTAATGLLLAVAACDAESFPAEPSTDTRLTGDISSITSRRDTAQVTLTRVEPLNANADGRVVLIPCAGIVVVRANGTRRQGGCSDLIDGGRVTAFFPDGGLPPEAVQWIAIFVVVSEARPDQPRARVAWPGRKVVDRPAAPGYVVLRSVP